MSSSSFDFGAFAAFVKENPSLATALVNNLAAPATSAPATSAPATSAPASAAPAVAPVAAPAPVAAAPAPVAAAPAGYATSKTICRYVLSNTPCPWGDKCHFSHDVSLIGKLNHAGGKQTPVVGKPNSTVGKSHPTVGRQHPTVGKPNSTVEKPRPEQQINMQFIRDQFVANEKRLAELERKNSELEERVRGLEDWNDKLEESVNRLIRTIISLHNYDDLKNALVNFELLYDHIDDPDGGIPQECQSEEEEADTASINATSDEQPSA